MERLRSWFARLFLREPKPFTSKRDVNWKALKLFGGIGVGVAVVIVLLLPNPKPEKLDFHEQGAAGSDPRAHNESPDPSQDAITQMYQAQGARLQVPASLDGLYSKPSGGQAPPPNRGSPMILAREGMDSRTQLPPGSQVVIRLTDKITVAGQAMPVIAIVPHDFVYADGPAIPQGSKLFGEASFNEATDRASVSWRTIELPDGRRRPISAIGVGLDGQVGLDGRIHSDAIKNTIGETLTRFIGAYAQGSMQQGMMGATNGGADNGLKNAVAETAKARADAWAEDMKKERRWIELEAGAESFAVLNQPFIFRDPGGTYGN